MVFRYIGGKIPRYFLNPTFWLVSDLLDTWNLEGRISYDAAHIKRAFKPYGYVY